MPKGGGTTGKVGAFTSEPSKSTSLDIGLAAGQNRYAVEPLGLRSNRRSLMTPSVALVTGSTTGLGRALAIELARAGAFVIVHGRDAARGADVVAQIEAEASGAARFYQADFASLPDVRRFAGAIRTDHERLDLLINNAGLGSTPAGSREVGADGHELLFAVNYLAGVLLTRELLPLIVSSAPSRIINISSIGQEAIDFDDVQLEKGYSDMRAYCQSKLAQVMFTLSLADELEGSGVQTASIHPATFMDTGMVRDAGFEAQTTVAEGAAAVLRLVHDHDLENGRFYDGESPGRALDQAYDRSARDLLRTMTSELI
jgi:NAD(P)-dependent dehydrogenase (short-subunit alcohol dehydrogenase family)